MASSRVDFAGLRSAISSATGLRLETSPLERVGGGCINECVRWGTDAGPLFIKLSGIKQLDVFEAEAAGLQELAQPAAVRVPAVMGLGIGGDHAFLALEWLDLVGSDGNSDARLGEQLAHLHRTRGQGFGWYRDNTIGSTPQLNGWSMDWTEFFAGRRLGCQFDLAERNGYGGRLTERGAVLRDSCAAFNAGREVVPSLLHGDLWGGNKGTDASGMPVIFDPATYFGDREADLAMTRLFGGFAKEFYEAYESVWPLDGGAELRTDLYNLYHVLNHLNLFGGGYAAQAQAMIDRLLGELGH